MKKDALKKYAPKEAREQIEKGHHGLGWSHRRWLRIYERIDKEAIVFSARKLAEAHPKESPVKLSRRAVRRAARASAAVGIVAASPALIPGIGLVVSLLGTVPEELYLMRSQCEMVLRIAALHGFDIVEDERLYELITLCGSPTKSVEMLMSTKYDLGRMAAKAAIQVGRRTERGALLGARAASRGFIRRLPALGFFAGSAINYHAFHSLGKRATRFYAELAKRERAEQEQD